MSNVTSLLSNGYYSLNNQSAVSQHSTSTSTLGGTTTPLNNGNSSSANASYALNLSAEALSYLKNLNSNTSASPLTAGGIDSFVLNSSQQKTLNSIIAKYQDAPFTQETFASIQDDMEKAGLSASVLGAQDQARNFNPTQFLIDALNGTSSNSHNGSMLDMFGSISNAGGGSTATSTETKATNFMTSVADAWARISTTAKSAASAS